MTSAADLLADRYGRRPKANDAKRRLGIWVLVAVALTVFVIWAFSSIGASSSSVAVISSASKPLTATSFQVSGKVTRPTAGIVRCALQVQSLNFAVVGYREITLAAGVTSFNETVFSVAPGVSASVTHCWLQ